MPESIKIGRLKIEDWSSVIWSDECKIQLFPANNRKWCWKEPKTVLDSRSVVPTVKYKYGGNLIVWGCFTSKGVGCLVKIENGLDAKLYRKILSEDLKSTLKCE